MFNEFLQRLAWGPKKTFPTWLEVTFEPRNWTPELKGKSFSLEGAVVRVWETLSLYSRVSTPFTLVKITPRDVGFQRHVTPEKFLERVRYHGLLPCPPHLAVTIREAVTVQDPKYIYLGSGPIAFGIGLNYFFRLVSKYGKLYLGAVLVEPDKKHFWGWDPDSEHIFVLP